MNERGGEVRGVAPETIDRLSLEQALTDADISIARARDLAMRLVELRDELAVERAANVQLRAELDELRGRHDAVLGNRAYKLAAKIWTIRQAIGV